MIEKLKCCFKILISKQYIVFTGGLTSNSLKTSCYIKLKQKAFLEATISFINNYKKKINYENRYNY